MSYRSPKNKEDFWFLVEKNWIDISHICDLYLKTFSKQWIDEKPLDISLGEYLLELKNTKNPRLVRALSAAYYASPADINEHDIPGLDIIAKLCEDEYVIYEPKEEKGLDD
jgi:hypothetical protein